MLIEPTVGCAPAVADRRRSLLLVAALAASLLGGVACASPSHDTDWSGIRSALERAVSEVDRWDGAAARQIERLIADAEAATAAERAAPFWSRGSATGAAAWERAAFEAAQLLRRLRAEELASRSRLAWLTSVARDELETVERRVGRAGMTGRQAAMLSSARVRLESAGRLAAADRLDEAIAGVEDALQLAAELDSAWQRQHERFSDEGLLALWRSQVEETVAESRRAGTSAIVVDKYHRQLILYRAGREVARYRAEIGSNGLARKRHAGDRATPEGRYRVATMKGPGATRYHLALLLDYPNAEDRRRYRTGVASGDIPRGVGIGSLIEIHGEGGTGRDWTDGCVALANADMEHLFRQVAVGTQVTIVGAR